LVISPPAVRAHDASGEDKALNDCIDSAHVPVFDHHQEAFSLRSLLNTADDPNAINSVATVALPLTKFRFINFNYDRITITINTA
jgi:hypothetical protein